MTFKLKSGNKPGFKQMGSSPLHVHDGTTSSTTHGKDGSPKTDDYQKRKEALLDKGFTQEDADWMIKHGGDVLPTPAPEHPKYEKKKSPMEKNDKLRGSKKERVVKMHKKHAGKPGFQAFVDKTFGGKTEIKDGKSITITNI